MRAAPLLPMALAVALVTACLLVLADQLSGPPVCDIPLMCIQAPGQQGCRDVESVCGGSLFSTQAIVGATMAAALAAAVTQALRRLPH